MKRQFFTSAGVHVREAEGESRTIAGYAIKFGVPSLPLWEDDREVAREIISAEAVSAETLAASDIKMTMYHDRQLLLARSNRGKADATLRYGIDDKGVWFEFEAPRTADGDTALELVRRGDLEGCSFAFTTDYRDESCVKVSKTRIGDRIECTYTVKKIREVFDFTLAGDPAYPQTSVSLREAIGAAAPHGYDGEAVKQLRREANKKIL